MIIVALLGALLFYVALYLIWTSTQIPLDSVAAVLGAIERMMWVPETTVFTIFRGILIIVTFYVVAEFFFSAGKRATRKRNNKEKTALSWKKPPRI